MKRRSSAVLETDFAAIVLDVRMPGLSGFEVAKLLRGRQRNRHTPIIFLTANAGDDFTVEEAYAAGAVDYLVKPLIPIVLRAKVAVFVELFRRTREARAAERREAEAAVREQSQIWRTTLASIGDAVIATDLEGRVTFLNPVAESLTGWTAPHAHGQPLTEVFRIVHETTRESVDNPALRAMKTGAIVALANHTVLIARDGSERLIDDSAAPIRGEADAVNGAVLVFRDVTDRRQAEAAQARLAAIVESSDDAIVGKTLEGIIQFWNAGAERVFGYTAAEAIGQPITLIVPPERLAEERQILARLRNGERVEHFETIRLTKDGRRIDISLTVSPIRDQEGHIIGASKVARDISHQREAEKRLRLSEERRRLALDAAGLGTWNIDAATNALTTDERFRTIFHGSTVPISFDEAFAALHPEDRERSSGQCGRGDAARRSQTLRGGVPCRPPRRLNASWVSAKGRANFEHDESGRRLTSLDGTVSDITDRVTADLERERLQERFREKDQRLQLLLENAADYAVVFTDPLGRILDWMGGTRRSLVSLPPMSLDNWLTSFSFRKTVRPACPSPKWRWRLAKGAPRTSDGISSWTAASSLPKG